MLQRSDLGNAGVLVALDFGDQGYSESLDELRQLAQSAGIEVRATVKGKRQRPDSALFAGSGKVEEISQVVLESNSAIVIFNHDLSPAQERNLETQLQCRVIDRTNLILDIFAQRARSHEGKLQVELAQLEHLSTRLIRGWTHLERQKGGIGLRGPGETQLETDRRLIGKRVKLLKDKLESLRLQRQTQRRARRRARTGLVSIVGYTNAGKSTLFNVLTRSQAFAADQLFATLDTTARKLYRENNTSLVVSDTVGFIRQLPHSLVEAFRATLEEAAEADCLIHVVDAGSSVREQQIAAVNEVLAEIGAHRVPQILVFNKIDTAGLLPRMEQDDNITRVWLSAKTGEGVDLLRLALDQIGVSQGSEDTEYRTVA
jgi:GTPase